MKPLAIAYLLILVLGTGPLRAHSGGTNRDGCHRDHSNDDYHCHSPREPGAYERQMEGYRQSRSGNGSSLLGLIVIGGIAVAFYFHEERKRNDRSTKVNRKRPSQRPRHTSETAPEAKNKKVAPPPPKKKKVLWLPPEHKQYLNTPFRLRCDEASLDDEDVQLLKKFGSWLRALSLGDIEPITDEQISFQKDCDQFRYMKAFEMKAFIDGRSPFSNKAEGAWFRYLYQIRIKHDSNS